MAIIKRYIVLIFLVYSFGLHANEFKQLTTLDGLSQNDVNCIFQDSRGFIWIGTNDGLNRYDGYSFKIYRKQPRQEDGLAGNVIHVITEDKLGNLWIGTSDNGVCKFDVANNAFKSYLSTADNPELSSSDRILKLQSDSSNNIWVITHQGVNVINDKSGEIISIPEEEIYHKKGKMPGGFIRDVFIDDQGAVWLGTMLGLRKINTQTYKVEWQFIAGSTSRSVNGIYGWNNHLLTYNSNGIQFFNTKTNVFTNAIRITGVKDIQEDDHGNLWIATSNGLVLAREEDRIPLKYQITKSYKSNSEVGLQSFGSVIDIYKDKSGLIWFGMRGGGVNIYNPKSELFRQFQISNKRNRLSNSKVRDIHEDKYGWIWIVTEGDGLNVFSELGNTNFSTSFIHKDLNSETLNNRGYAIAEDTLNNRIWIGAGNPDKLKVYNTKTKNGIDINQWNLKPSHTIFSILVDHRHCVWLGSYGGGLLRLMPDGTGAYAQYEMKSDSSAYSLPSNIVRSLFQDQQGNVWIGTTNGLAKIKANDLYTERPRIFRYQYSPNNAKSISHNYILPVYESVNGDIWIGTLGGGLNRYVQTADGNEYFETFTVDDGLPNNVIKGILEDDDNNLWLSSNKGLTKFNIETHEISNYDVGDGLQDYEFSELACCKRKNGEFLFGGVRGINAFFPEQIKQDKSTGTVVFTQLDILNQPVEIHQKIRGRILLSQDINETTEIHLKYAENSFTFHYSGLHFGAPLKNQYKYMLEGFDDDWIYTTSDNRVAKYTNIRPGNYTLKVVASNSDGVWNHNAKTIRIKVIAPWWLSVYAFVVYALILVVFLLFFRRFSIIGVQQKNKLLMERFEKEKVEEISQLKFRFFTNISHEFRTPLTLIIGPIEKIFKEREAMSAQKLESMFDIIYRNSKVLLRLVNQLMDFRKFEQGKSPLKASKADIVGFVKNIYSSFEEYAREKQIEFEVSSTSKEILLWFDSDKMEKILYNLLSNAFKFTPDKGKIYLELTEDEQVVKISVQDTGIGMTETQKAHVFERFFQTNNAENIKYGSTGIGLAYTKALVEIHKGRIEVDSQEGVGTIFTVTLSKGKAHLDKDEICIGEPCQNVENSIQQLTYDETTLFKTSSTVAYSPEKKTLLLVEDNNELRSFIKESLADEFNIIVAENGEIGLEKCKQEDVDLIISDVRMPEMDGFEMCKAIKEEVNISHVPIILLTAKTSNEYVIKGYNLGADAYVAKPFNMEVLRAQINNLILKRENNKASFAKNIEVIPSEIAPTTTDEKFLSRLLTIIEARISDSEFTVDDLMDEYGISQVILNRKLKALTGQTAKLFIRSIRLKRAAQLLATGKYSIADVAYEVGFSDPKYFRNCFKNELGVAPSEYKKQHLKGE